MVWIHSTKSFDSSVMRVLLFICVAVFLFPSGSEGAETSEDSDKMIRIGVAGAHSGDLASLGIPSLRAVRIAAKMQNGKGGIFGRKIEIIDQDDQCKLPKAAEAAKKLLSDNISMIVGHTCSSATKAALDIYKDSKVVVISSSSTNPALTQSGRYPGFFRTISPDDAQARLQVDFLLKVLKFAKIAVVHDNDDYGRGQAAFAKEFLAESGNTKVVLSEEIVAGAADYSGIADKIRESGAQAVIYGGYYPEASKIILQMRIKKMKTVFMGGDGVMNKSFLKSVRSNAEGLYTTGPRDMSGNKMAAEVIDMHKKVHGDPPGQFYLNAYAGTLALFNAIRKSGSMDYDSVIRFLRLSYISTPIGAISFDRKGDVRGYGFSLFKIADGKYVEVEVK
ncbi:branched-chain amino acid ABC transporter substrate-binding protein [Desulfobacterales bacterium HSG2]|nr:branched-chain amino acid ABC transporter substrate-binding protein [Desulfobacterales bacterium HSG2]